MRPIKRLKRLKRQIDLYTINKKDKSDPKFLELLVKYANLKYKVK